MRWKTRMTTTSTMSASKKRTPPRDAPGPEPERLQIDGDWEDAVRDALKKPPPKKQPDEKQGRRD